LVESNCELWWSKEVADVRSNDVEVDDEGADDEVVKVDEDVDELVSICIHESFDGGGCSPFR
jgi:hypothetical protein